MSMYNFARAALAAGLLAAVPIAAPAQVYVSIGVNIAPPAIPVYVQPPCPASNYIWQPGYWAWGAGGYYWVPGTWVLAPAVGLLWTPGYWGWGSGAYYWHRGYWARTVGFYGGINYGFGYFGVGYVGGGWYGNVFRYNTAITRVNTVVIHNTYVDKTVIHRNYYNNSRVSYNGGHGGIQARPTQAQVDARAHGQPATPEQQSHEQMSGQDRNHYMTVNHGQPTSGAVAHPYSASNRPAHSAPVTDSDKQAAHQHESSAKGQQPPQ